jgi:hypothetical protein
VSGTGGHRYSSDFDAFQTILFDKIGFDYVRSLKYSQVIEFLLDNLGEFVSDPSKVYPNSNVMNYTDGNYNKKLTIYDSIIKKYSTFRSNLKEVILI